MHFVALKNIEVYKLKTDNIFDGLYRFLSRELIVFQKWHTLKFKLINIANYKN